METKKNQNKKKAPNKGGRPELAENAKKKNRFSIQFSDIELQEIKDFLEEKKFQKKFPNSSFFQDLILNTIKNRPILSTTQVMNFDIVALNRIGNNLNQLAKKANSINTLGADDRKKINTALDELSKTLKKL